MKIQYFSLGLPFGLAPECNALAVYGEYLFVETVRAAVHFLFLYRLAAVTAELDRKSVV